MQHRINSGWMKWRKLSRVLCDKKIYFIKLDPGEKLLTDNPSWAPDKEPEPSPMDPWLSYMVPVVQQKPKEEPEAHSTPQPSPVTEASPSSVSAPKSADEDRPGGLSEQVYTRYQPSTEWPPAAVESVLRHSMEPAKPKPPAESPPKGQTRPSRGERPSASSRKSKEAAPPSPLQAEVSDIRRARLPPIKSKSEMKKAKSRAGSPASMEIPRPPVLPLSALPPSRCLDQLNNLNPINSIGSS
ncbi:vegetative cell wall protein gp1-like [Schistocerca americana]|uniref:vegetative cell wall protein gp1-like n=1 Tax=Schistocerca americana TaxID=7009 RepID=UPI001F502382|nr:vegetative cell wall protein gp1-like [Schistocerca americana]